jgi:hypothetical protein
MNRISETERQDAYARLHRSPEIRAAVIRKLEMLTERYPMLRLGQILQNALPGDLYNVEDDALLRALDQLLITYSQFQAAGIKP